jgi:hypothetical protein
MRIIPVALASLLLLGWSAEARAQRPDSTDTEWTPSPSGAVLRSVVVPGWGQYYVAERHRAAAYVVLAATSHAMLQKSIRRLGAARDIAEARALVARDSIWLEAASNPLLARRLEEPGYLEQQVERDTGVIGARTLAASRTRHRQDWIAYTLAVTAASALDAFVGAHLYSAPWDLAPSIMDGRASLSVSVPVGGR